MSRAELLPRHDAATILILDDDPQVREGVLAMLEREGRRVVVCSDAESAELALREFRFTHVVADLQLSKLPFEGVAFVDVVRRALPDCRIVVMTGYSSPIVKSTALSVGADAFLSKPFGASDLAGALRLEAAPPAEPTADSALRVSDIGELLSGVITARFQPIADLFSIGSAVHGFEALARVPAGWPFRDMGTLLEYALRKGRSAEVNAMCVEGALCEGAPLLSRGLLFVKVSPDAIGTPPVLDAIRRSIAKKALDSSRIVMELTEGGGSDHMAEGLAGIEVLRQEGISFAVYDTDGAAGDLRLIEQIRPAFIKVGHGSRASFQLDGSKTAMVRLVVARATALSAEVILEGIDNHEALVHARRHGIRYGQGFRLGAPMDVAAAAAFQLPLVESG